MDYNEMIDTLVKEVLKRMNKSSKNALVMFTGVSGNLDEAVNGINSLKDDGWNIKALLSSEFKKEDNSNQALRLLKADSFSIEDEVSDEDDILKNIEIIVIPVLTIDVLAKSALGIADTMMTRLMAEAIMTGIPIIAVRDECDIENFKKRDKKYAKMPNAYIKKVKGYIADLQEYGVKFTEAKFLYSNLSNNSCSKSLEKKSEIAKVVSKNVITREDIMLAQNSGKSRICVAKNTIITSLAKDAAKELGVEIECI